MRNIADSTITKHAESTVQYDVDLIIYKLKQQVRLFVSEVEKLGVSADDKLYGDENEAVALRNIKKLFWEYKTCIKHERLMKAWAIWIAYHTNPEHSLSGPLNSPDIISNDQGKPYSNDVPSEYIWNAP